MAKKDAVVVEYIAIVGLTNDETGKHFEPGKPVPAGAFPEKVIQHWLATGKLALKETSPEAVTMAKVVTLKAKESNS